MVISQEDGTDVPPKWVLDHWAPAFLSMADQLLLTRLHQQESDDLQRQPVPKIFPNFELKSLSMSFTPWDKPLYSHTGTPVSVPGPSACSHGCPTTTPRSAHPR